MKILFRALQITVYFCVIAFVILTLWLVVNGEISAGEPKVEYKDFVAILLTGLAVMIAVATVLAAMGAIWGYVIIREEINRTVERIASARAEEIANKKAAEVARESVSIAVPKMIREVVDFIQQGEEQGRADEIAEEYGREGTENE